MRHRAALLIVLLAGLCGTACISLDQVIHQLRATGAQQTGTAPPPSPNPRHEAALLAGKVYMRTLEVADEEGGEWIDAWVNDPGRIATPVPMHFIPSSGATAALLPPSEGQFQGTKVRTYRENAGDALKLILGFDDRHSMVYTPQGERRTPESIMMMDRLRSSFDSASADPIRESYQRQPAFILSGEPFTTLPSEARMLFAIAWGYSLLVTEDPCEAGILRTRYSLEVPPATISQLTAALGPISLWRSPEGRAAFCFTQGAITWWFICGDAPSATTPGNRNAVVSVHRSAAGITDSPDLDPSAWTCIAESLSGL